MAPDMRMGRGMGHIRNSLVLSRRSLMASTPDPISCLTVANVSIKLNVLSWLSSLGSISTLTASFALQDQHPIPIILSPNSSILSPIACLMPSSRAEVLTSPLWHLNPDSLHCYLSVPLPPSCLVLKCYLLSSPPVTSCNAYLSSN